MLPETAELKAEVRTLKNYAIQLGQSLRKEGIDVPVYPGEPVEDTEEPTTPAGTPEVPATENADKTGDDSTKSEENDDDDDDDGD